MISNQPYLPEGMNITAQETAASLLSSADITRVLHECSALEMTVQRCDNSHALHGAVGRFPAVIPRCEAIAPCVSGAEKEVAVLSLVGKRVLCELTGSKLNSRGETVLFLSRKRVQEKALLSLRETLSVGDVIPAVVTSISPPGIFADIGAGIIALLPIRHISMSHISHPRERFALHQKIYTAVSDIDWENNRILLSSRELLGTWAENAAAFQSGETVTGIVRSIKSYGVFIELSPNLTGLAEPSDALHEGDRVSVLIKSIQPEKHKVKLHVMTLLPPSAEPVQPIRYFITEGNVRDWQFYR